MVMGVRYLRCHYVPFVADPALASIRPTRISGRADDDDELILPNRTLHESWQLIAGDSRPLVNLNINSIGTEALGQFADPVAVSVVIPRIRNKCRRVHRSPACPLCTPYHDAEFPSCRGTAIALGTCHHNSPGPHPFARRWRKNGSRLVQPPLASSVPGFRRPCPLA